MPESRRINTYPVATEGELDDPGTVAYIVGVVNGEPKLIPIAEGE